MVVNRARASVSVIIMVYCHSAIDALPVIGQRMANMTKRVSDLLSRPAGRAYYNGDGSAYFEVLETKFLA